MSDEVRTGEKKSAKDKKSKNTGLTNGSSKSDTRVYQFTPDQEIAVYRDMLLIRRFEEKSGQLYGMGFIGGFCHLYIGRDAVVVGL